MRLREIDVQNGFVKPHAAFARLHSLVARRGLTGTVRRILFLARQRLFPAWQPSHPFDAAHGVVTGGLLSQKDLQTGHENDVHTTAYYGTQPSTFRGGLEQWRTAIANSSEHVEDFTFVDIGCGKGRVLMLASKTPFHRVLGLELNPEIADIARKNVHRWSERSGACEQVGVVTGDVLAFPLPSGPTLLYMYNPFEGDLFKRWVQQLAFSIQERTAPLYLLYTYPRYEAFLTLLPSARLLWAGEVPLDRKETVTDLFGCVAEQVSLYRLCAGNTPPEQSRQELDS